MSAFGFTTMSEERRKRYRFTGRCWARATRWWCAQDGFDDAACFVHARDAVDYAPWSMKRSILINEAVRDACVNAYAHWSKTIKKRDPFMQHMQQRADPDDMPRMMPAFYDPLMSDVLRSARSASDARACKRCAWLSRRAWCPECRVFYAHAAKELATGLNEREYTH